MGASSDPTPNEVRIETKAGRNAGRRQGHDERRYDDNRLHAQRGSNRLRQ
jgi:hypothetical protein